MAAFLLSAFSLPTLFFLLSLYSFCPIHCSPRTGESDYTTAEEDSDDDMDDDEKEAARLASRPQRPLAGIQKAMREEAERIDAIVGTSYDDEYVLV